MDGGGKSQGIPGKKVDGGGNDRLLRREGCGILFTGVKTEKETEGMEAQLRREKIAQRLEQARGPVSATALAREFSVSRQIIVGDVALLRAGGLDIAATPRGYVLPARSSGERFVVATVHGAASMQAELNAIVDQGCTVEDVIVEHPIYGQITAPLRLSSRYEVEQFVQRCREEAAAPLSLLTDGVHLHTVICQNAACEERVKAALKEIGVLLES